MQRHVITDGPTKLGAIETAVITFASCGITEQSSGTHFGSTSVQQSVSQEMLYQVGRSQRSTVLATSKSTELQEPTRRQGILVWCTRRQRILHLALSLHNSTVTHG